MGRTGAIVHTRALVRALRSAAVTTSKLPPPVLTRFAAIGDVHVEDVRLAAVLTHVQEQNVDAILSVGDIVDGPGDVDRTVALLRKHGVYAVRGNHDRWLVEGAANNG